MNFDSVVELKDHGFEGFKPISELFKDCTCVPQKPGIYMVLRPGTTIIPEFVSPGTGGKFKQRDPNVSEDRLASKWLKERLVVYIGKAGGAGRKATLQSRIRLYLHFGQGKPAAHSGGRYVWQLKDSADLVLCWKTSDKDPGALKADLIAKFSHTYGQRPFANLAG
jgi:hypothetical protein